MKALVTVELQLCSDFLFSLGSFNGVQHKIDRLMCSGLVCNYAVVIQISDDGKIQYTLLCVYVRNVRCPLLVRSVGFEILFPEVVVFMQIFAIFVEPTSSDYRQ